MAAKKMTPPPIDRPLSKAYLRQFAGWSTAYPPGQSEPNSLRLMENVFVDRNGALNVRHGLRYLSYTTAPDLDPFALESPGTPLDRPPVGGMETFYLNDGSRALLFAVREGDGAVGFRALLFSDGINPVHRLSDPEVGFTIPQGEGILNFSKDTTHVEYVQINNRILALSDNGEEARMFFVGGQKLAKRLSGIAVPLWEDTHKPTAFHPDAAWILSRSGTRLYNSVLNPSFEIGTKYWNVSSSGTIGISRTAPAQGLQSLTIETLPERTNMQRSPLHDVPGTGLAGWRPAPDLQECTIAPEGDFMRVLCDPGDGLFLASGSKIIDGVVPRKKYLVSVDFSVENETPAIISATFFSMNGARIDTRLLLSAGTGGGQFISLPITAPDGATSMRIELGGDATGWGAVNFKNLLVCPDGEPLDFFHGGSGTDFYWLGDANASASVYHPPRDVEVWSDRVHVVAGKTLRGSIRAAGSTVPSKGSLRIRYFDKLQRQVSTSTGAFPVPTGVWTSTGIDVTAVISTAVQADIGITITQAAKGEQFRIDMALLSPTAPAGLGYFDGSSLSGSMIEYGWSDPRLPHETASTRFSRAVAAPALAKETATADTLVATGGAAVNDEKMAFFYTFSNEVGESAPSKMTEIRMQRAWSNWLWQIPDATGKPAAETVEDELCCDQIVVRLPSTVYDQAVAAGAIGWNLYAMAWSDQDPVPATAQLAAVRDLFPDNATGALRADHRAALPYAEGGWLAVTPQRIFTVDDAILPTQGNRSNSSIPPKHRNGTVAGDRIILVGDPDNQAGVSWSSSRPGEYTNFSSAKGGGEKTLTSGNLNIPVAVTLWQNPQSVDTLAVLCTGDDGRSNSYYMHPAKVESSSAGTVPVMGFEETTSTPGTVSPFAVQVLNNSLIRPVDRSLMKSTASNYNINHKTLSDTISNLWWGMRDKRKMMAASLDNRIYYLVDNAVGEVLRPNCNGNEIWILDIAAEKPHWSRLTIQAVALRPVDVGSRTYMGVIAADGLYYLDIDTRVDDYVSDLTGYVQQRPIPWMFETNTQGANRAHDAWAHLQQVGITLGNFQGSVVYGVRGRSINGSSVDMWKQVEDPRPVPSPALPRWDFEDSLLIRRDMKEWFFYAHSIPDKESSGLISLVQYRYTPVTVNVGYEYGSIETQEYGRDALGLGGTNTVDGIPIPFSDRTRP